MAIIGALPVTLTNGTTADATQVMSDFNFIVNAVNANANPAGTLTAPAGTRVVFQQATTPVGWTNDVSAAFQDCAMRFNNGAGTGGSINWSSWNFGGTFFVNSFTLAVGQLPAHNHGVSDPGHNHTTNDPGHTHGLSGSVPQLSGGTDLAGNGGTHITYNAAVNGAFTGVSNNPALTGITTQNTGSGGTITPSYTTPQVKFADCVVGVKN